MDGRITGCFMELGCIAEKRRLGVMIDRLKELLPYYPFSRCWRHKFRSCLRSVSDYLQYTGYRMSYWISFAVGLFFMSLMNIYHIWA